VEVLFKAQLARILLLSCSFLLDTMLSKEACKAGKQEILLFDANNMRTVALSLSHSKHFTRKLDAARKLKRKQL
jgi:hypothetical protein